MKPSGTDCSDTISLETPPTSQRRRFFSPVPNIPFYSSQHHTLSAYNVTQGNNWPYCTALGGVYIVAKANRHRAKARCLFISFDCEMFLNSAWLCSQTILFSRSSQRYLRRRRAARPARASRLSVAVAGSGTR